MKIDELKAQIDVSPVGDRATLQKMFLFATAGGDILPCFAAYLERSSTYQEFFNEVYRDESQKRTLLWAECAKLNRRNWLAFFEPKMLIEKLRMKTDGLPVQMGSAVMLAPTGSRDNIANLYVFPADGFNQKAAEFVTSLGGKFTVADYDFFGIYGLYKYRGNVILEEWQVEAEPAYNPEPEGPCGL
ncbi:hypothetical protein [Adlercreutzia sp. ZJ242]|uniref:hypothetical protein n=1 Tax=Adlercreutzia sp. ZJ242 TaxID=2709409 RepID=UPI0013EAD398|nr:hypothetical protein [Adlercreutzia sp. ZJ242]